MIVVETETYCSGILINTHPTWTVKGSNQGLHADRPAADHMNEGKATKLPIRPLCITNSYLYILEVPSEESWDRAAPAVLLVPAPLFSFGYLQLPPQWGSTQSA